MGTPTKEQTIANVRAGVVEEIAVNLKKNYKLFDNSSPPTDDAEYIRMANELIDSREFKLPNKTVIKLDDLKNKLNDLTSLSDDAKGLVDQSVKVLDEIPTTEDIEKIGGSIHAGVEKSTSFFGSFGGFFEAIMNYIMGFIDWLAGACKTPLMECIGERFTGTTSKFVVSELEKQREEDPRLASMLTNERIAQIDQQVRAGVVESFTNDKKDRGSALVGVTQEDKIKTLVMDTVHKEIDDQFAKQDNAATTNKIEGLVRKTMVEKGLSGEGDIVAVKDALTQTMDGLVQDSATAKLDNDKLREVIAKGVTDKLPWDGEWIKGTFGGAEGKLAEAIVKGADSISVVDDATLDKLKKASELYNQGLGRSTSNASLPLQQQSSGLGQGH